METEKKDDFYPLQVLRQYQIDLENLLRENNDLGESFLQQSFPSHLDKMLDTSSNISLEIFMKIRTKAVKTFSFPQWVHYSLYKLFSFHNSMDEQYADDSFSLLDYIM